MVVGRGGSCELEYEVESEGSVLRWEFISTSYDVSYGLFYKSESVENVEKKSSKQRKSVEEVVCKSYNRLHRIKPQGFSCCIWQLGHLYLIPPCS